ncbi:MAG TPA: anti-sigma factor [Steroidobacteraceae bacterium]
MKRDEPENLDLIAAEYALGTLRGPARRSFERRRRRDPFVDRRVTAWEERFALLALRLKPVAPSADVWRALQRRIGGGARSAWRALAAAVALFAVLGFGWIVWQELRAPQATAEFASAGGETLWRVELAARGDRLEVATLGKPAVPEARARELWALPEGGAPVSLGLMPASGEARLALDSRQQAALKAAANIAVSDEPAGGSPTGAPTGDVLYIAAIVRT